MKGIVRDALLTGMLPSTFVLLMAVSGSSEAPAAANDAASFEPFDLVGICAVESQGRTWSVVWHPRTTGADPAALRVFRHLEAPDVNDCLTLLLESDDATRDAVLRYASEPTVEHAQIATQGARRRWTAFAVDRAIREVAETGARGPGVDRVLAACKEIRDPVRIIGAPEEVRP